MAFDLDAHHLHVQEHGERVRYRQGMKCPCGLSEDPTRARPTCKVCQGRGFRYGPEKSMTALVTGIQTQKAWLATGMFLPSDLLIGFSPYERTPVSDWDIFRLPWSTGLAYEGDLRVRNPDPEEPDFLSYEVQAVHGCFAIDPQDQVVAEYVLGTDFTITGRSLTWLPSKGPEPRQKYSLKYHAIFDWVAFVSPMQRFDAHTDIGPRAMLRKYHMAAGQATPF